MGDYRLSPTYDLLNSRVHIEDKVFPLDWPASKKMATG